MNYPMLVHMLNLRKSKDWLIHNRNFTKLISMSKNLVYAEIEDCTLHHMSY